MRWFLSLALVLFPLPLIAQMSAEAFDRYTRGKTLFYAQEGEIYGGEIYRPGRRVTWSFLDGDCREGEWYAEGELICFVYEDNPVPQCWAFELQGGGLIARFEGSETATALYEAREGGEELVCLGPKVGV